MPKLLILSSNPRRDLNLEREVSDLVTAVQRLEKFEVRLGLGVRSQELPELLAEHSPEVVHFCGHGAGEQGLVFQDEQGLEQFVSTEILARLFKVFANEINCVVLNACDSDRQAEAIVAHINYVVGMSQAILDKAAYYFATGFYQGLAHGKSIEQSYELGCIAIQIWVETNSVLNRLDRKLEWVGESSQPDPDLQEYSKPVLRKKSTASKLSLESLVESSQQFTEFVQQEIDRKEYKDQSREAYDRFGQFTAQPASDLGKSEYQQRQILVAKVKEFWIEGFLNPSLQGIDALKLEMKARPDTIAGLSQGIEALSVNLDSSYESLRETHIYEEIGQGRTLLILGEPGAGKTIALLQLAERLLDRSEQNLSLPLPVVLNLSSWAKEQKTIVDWLIDELREKYQVPKVLSEPWIRQQQFILLLDGLDEVDEQYRNDCVRAINAFIALFPQTEIAICSRVRDYEALTEQLQISTALCLQPLSTGQTYRFLDQVGGSLAGLKALLERNAELEQFAQTPLILNFMSVAYQGWSVDRLMQELGSTSDRSQHLFDTYVDRRLERGAAEYPKEKVIRWLSWLGDRMVREKQTVFLIEKMQPTWLKNHSEARIYRIGTFIVPMLTVGLIVVLIYGLIYELRIGLIYGLSIGLIGSLITSLPKKILPLEKLSWSWQRAKSRFIREFFTGFGFGLLFELSFGLLFEILFKLRFGLSFGLLFGLGSGLGNSEIAQRAVPNQGIRTSQKNGIFVELLVGLSAGLLVGLLFRLSAGLLIGLSFGLNAGLKYGWAACIQHFILRRILYRKGRIPWNYTKFLDFASDRLLMKKIGGGYVFFHRMLLEHFAQMNLN